MESSTLSNIIVLISFHISRNGEVIKKFDFLSLQPLTETLKENRLADMMHQAVRNAFVNNKNIMTNSFQNAMVKAMKEGVTLGFRGSIDSSAT